MNHIDQTAAIAIKGYAWLSDLRRRADGLPVPMRVMCRRAVAISGPSATRLLYGEGNVERHSALPMLVVDTLFGRGAVHTLDGEAHRVRKALFVAMLMDGDIDAPARHSNRPPTGGAAAQRCRCSTRPPGPSAAA